MAKFYYNGVLLPEIPQDMLAEYPYVVIVRTFSLSTTRFFAKKSPYYYNYSDYKVVSPEVGGQLCTLSDDGESWSSGTTLTGETSLINNPTAWELVWTTHDIPFDSITSTNIYFHSSNPIPENAEYWQIESGTLISFGDQARRISGTTERLSIEQMLEIFSGAGGGIDGLENGYDVMFYDENNMGLAFYSIKQGQGIHPPMYNCSNWIDQNGTAIVFPYTPTADISLWADNSTLSALLYDHFAISPEEYPYICIQIRNGTGTETTGIGFAKTMKMSTNASGTTSVTYSDVKSLYFSYNLWSYTIEEIVEYLMANYTSDSFTRNFVTYQSNANYYKFYVNHSLDGLSYTNWIQFK